MLIINPAEKLRETRDARRLDDYAKLHSAIAQLVARVGGSLDYNGPYHSGDCSGGDNTVYVSVPKVGDSCPSELPALPEGWHYNCVSKENLQKVDGSGWLPIDFTQVSPPPLSILPVDPVNDAASGRYYTYTCSSFELSCDLESEKYSELEKNDGGDDDDLYERGSDLTISPALGIEVTTKDATDVEASSATLNGSLDDLGPATNVTAYFYYDDSSPVQTADPACEQPMSAPGSFSCGLTGLTPGTTYYFRACAKGTISGEVREFCGVEKSFPTLVATGGLKGYAWNDSIGWISFADTINGCSPSSSAQTDHLTGWACNPNEAEIALDCETTPNGNICSQSNFRVNRDPATGILSGYAWNDSIGWISFNSETAGGPACDPSNGYGQGEYCVYIDQNGMFHGWAWNDYVGWITFNCEDLQQGATENCATTGCDNPPCTDFCASCSDYKVYIQL